MSIISFLINSISKKQRGERVEINSPCRYSVYRATDPKETFDNLKDATVVDISTRGLQLVTAPAFPQDVEETIKSDHCIYIEIFSEESGTTVRMQGEIRWIRTVRDIQKPYSQVGVMITSVIDDSKAELVDSLFTESDKDDTPENIAD